MLNILLMIILIIILFIIILLFIGIKIILIYDKTGPNLKGCLKILILKKIKVYSVDFPSEDESEDSKEEDEEEDDGEGNIKEIFNLAKPCLGYFKEFLNSFVKCIKVKKMDNHLIFGLDSYADTGKYIGYIWGLFTIVNDAHKNARLTAEPSFNGSVLDAKGDNEIDINILKIIPAAIRLLLKEEIRALIKGVING